jgi:alkanesulfonate monooxygenase SsuD/methylene tetrahydromethanopterin reductase-like flavin-dependent oxidoreductase (luciferase family)
VLAAHCREVGRDFDEIVRSSNVNNVLIGENQAEVDEKVAWFKHHFTPIVGAERAERMVEESSIGGGGVIGTPEQVIDGLLAYRDAGAGYLIAFFQDAAHDPSGLELFGREVIPALA